MTSSDLKTVNSNGFDSELFGKLFRTYTKATGTAYSSHLKEYPNAAQLAERYRVASESYQLQGQGNEDSAALNSAMELFYSSIARLA